MNTGILRICNYPGCQQTTTEAYCEKHKKVKEKQRKQKVKEYDDKRGNSYSRGYDKTWEKVRLVKLARDPVCESCQSIKNLLVHHIIPIADGGEKYDYNNLMTLCADCHYKIHHDLK